ncbi:N-acetylglucosamine-6-phosphate deacetylase [Ornithinimicrobium sp. Arc0846-15]|nr:N-acetylglucosamine-6-phosphate deacetylase [Ornithinimicrobium laminariae]
MGAGSLLSPGQSSGPGWLAIQNGRIAEVGHGEAPHQVDQFFPSHSILPGFVDIHVHGAGGGSFTTADPADSRRAANFLRNQGTTSMIASLVSAPHADLLRQIESLKDLVDEGLLAGIHLEGPWLAASRGGAHALSALRDPDPSEIDELLAAADGALQMVTLAPERPGAIAAISQLVDAGVTVAIGHTAASYGQTRAAINAGATVATHLFNAMPPIHHREPGPVVALLEDPRVTLELIADGHHLHPAIVAEVMRSAGPDRVAFVSDAMAAASMPDGQYSLGALEVSVSDGRAKLADGTIAGSTTTGAELMRSAVRANASAAYPLVCASALMSSTPAKALGLGEVGELTPGQWADLVVWDNNAQQVAGVMSRGEWVVRP